jgi:putative DNA primase/helicase
MNGVGIPAELRDRDQWHVWKCESRDGKATKVPYRATASSVKASSTDPATWATFEQATAAAPEADGIGFVFTADDPYTGIDLDDCFVGDELHPAAAAIVLALDSYTERSVSGTGLHIIVRAELRGDRNRTGKTDWGGQFEVYDRGRYFAMTGAVGKRRMIENRQEELDSLTGEMFPAIGPHGSSNGNDAAPRAALDLDDAELLARARAAKNGSDFERLYSGRHDYSSASEADMALCNMLAFWTGPDPDRISRMFRASGLYREKWERADYAQRTIENALKGRTEFYEPGTAGSNGHRPEAGGAATEASTGKAPPEFIARRLAEQLIAETPIAASAGGELYIHRGGAYRPGGEVRLRRRIALSLGDEWRRNKGDEVIGYIRAVAARIWAEPPRDRINVRNGILDLDTGKLGPHDPAFLSPVQIGAAYEPAATCPAIERFLAEVLAPELAALIHELVGYLVTPDQSLQIAFMFLGGGANGKSTTISLLTKMLGDENVSSVALHRLDEDRFSVAELEGKLCNCFADLDARALQASSMFKAITGGDAITGERKYANPFTFRPYARLVYSANEPPPTSDSSDAFFRRWVILPFERRFSDSEADRHILNRLTTPQELSGLLNRGLEVLPTLQERGAFTTTAITTRAAERFRVDSDSVAGFLGEVCELDRDARTALPRLFDAYRNWCAENNRRPLGKQRFNRHVEDLQPLTIGPIEGRDHWLGIRIRKGS